MKAALIFLISIFILFFLPRSIHAQNDSKNLGEVETNWPGIHYQIIIFKRIPPERLLVVVRVLATPQAPPGGTLLGFPVPIPPNIPRAEAILLYPPHPLSLMESVMTDEATQQKFCALPPVSSPGKAYRPSATLQILQPRHNIILTVQFAVPPPPPPDPATGAPAKQTVSFLLPNAKAPITHVPIPPVATASKPTN